MKITVLKGVLKILNPKKGLKRIPSSKESNSYLISFLELSLLSFHDIEKIAEILIY